MLKNIFVRNRERMEEKHGLVIFSSFLRKLSIVSSIMEKSTFTYQDFKIDWGLVILSNSSDQSATALLD